MLEHADVMEMMLPILRADMEIFETYRYAADEPLTCPVTALGGHFDAEVTANHLSEWRRHTTGKFSR